MLQKRSINLSGHATSLALEPEFWAALEAMAQGGAMGPLIGRIDAARGARALASACRVAALEWARAAAARGGGGSTASQAGAPELKPILGQP